MIETKNNGHSTQNELKKKIMLQIFPATYIFVYFLFFLLGCRHWINKVDINSKHPPRVTDNTQTQLFQSLPALTPSAWK